jgi:hypothetical protein
MLNHFHLRLQQSVGFGLKSRGTDGKPTQDGDRVGCNCNVPDRDPRFPTRGPAVRQGACLGRTELDNSSFSSF